MQSYFYWNPEEQMYVCENVEDGKELEFKMRLDFKYKKTVEMFYFYREENSLVWLRRSPTTESWRPWPTTALPEQLKLIQLLFKD